MIVVDTSVWIDHFRDLGSLPHVARLRQAFGQEPIIVGDLVMLEVLQGIADENRAVKVERLLRAFIVSPMLNVGLAVRAARNYRILRARGVTIRKTIDMIIGTYCLENSLPLLHHNSDFGYLEQHLGMATVECQPPSGN